MDIPIGVEVICGTQACGHSTYLVINPVNNEITHLVGAEKAFPYIERLVSPDAIIESSPTSIRLCCSQKELNGMDPFMEMDLSASDELENELPHESPHMRWPYGTSEAMPFSLEYEHIPAGEKLSFAADHR